MTIILDRPSITGKGTFEIRQTITVNISAEEARRRVHHWLLMEVSHMMGADEPTLVVSARTLWRVPAHLSTPHTGVIGQVGEVEVDAITGEFINALACKAAIEQCALKKMRNLPPFQPYTSVPEAYIPRHIAPAPRLVLNEADEPVLIPA